ncbi:MAG: HD-GYP domain-containing protein [Lachnospiraceae bacterium]|nr:HD-GYP domain-containing protein [Lachnospiraceae bacterium]
MEIKRINISEAAPGMLVAEDILNTSNQLIVPKDSTLTDKAIARMRFHMIGSFRIFVDDKSASAPAPAPEPKPAAEERSYFDKLRETEEFVAYSGSFNNTVSNMENEFKKMISGQKLADTETLTAATANLRASCRTGIQVFDLLHCFREYDDTTYAHSLNVSLICAVEGEWLGFSDKDIQTLIQCGLYHDVGKMMIPKDILDKTTPLTPPERKMVESHVVAGYNILKDKDIDNSIKLSAVMHHERCDGSGYPMNLTADKIDEFAKIVAIADVYEAMTSPRSYRKGKCPFEVLRLFESEGLTHFDPKYLMVFMENITQSYMGTRVRLNNGTVGTIVYINKLCYSKPLIQVANGNYVDLMKDHSLYIEAML